MVSLFVSGANLLYVGNDIYGVKWRNWKMMTRSVDTGFGEPVQTYGMPLIYDLYTDPKEEIGFGDPRTAGSLWVRWPAGEVLTQHMASFQREPAVPPGAADPYVPGR